MIVDLPSDLHFSLCNCPTIFNSKTNIEKKNELMERINQFNPLNLYACCLETAIEVLCHHEFKIFVSDALLLSDLVKDLMAYSRTQQAPDRVISWERRAQRVNQILQEKACFPILKLPKEIQEYILSFLSLAQISCLMRGCTEKIIDPTYTIQFRNPIKELLINAPQIILENPHTNHELKFRVCEHFYTICKEDSEKINRLFRALYQTSTPLLLSRTLMTSFTIPFKYGFLLKSRPSSFPHLNLDFRYLAQPTFSFERLGTPVEWSTWLQGYDSVTRLDLAIGVHGPLFFESFRFLVHQLLPHLTGIKEINMTFEGIAFEPSSFSWYQHLLSLMKKLEHLKLTFVQLDPDNSIASTDNILPHFTNHVNCTSNCVEALLKDCVSLSTLEVVIDYQPIIKQKVIELAKEIEDFYAVLYFNRFSSTFTTRFSHQQMQQMRLVIPIPPFSHITPLKDHPEAISENFLKSYSIPETTIEDDHMIFTLQSRHEVLGKRKLNTNDIMMSRPC